MKRHSTAFATLLLMASVALVGMGQSRQTVFSDSGEDTSTGFNLRDIVIKLDTNVYHLWNQAFTNLPNTISTNIPAASETTLGKAKLFSAAADPNNPTLYDKDDTDALINALPTKQTELSDFDFSALSTSAARITPWLDYTNSLQINYPSQVWVNDIAALQAIDPDVMRNDVAIVRDPTRGGIFQRVLSSGVTTNTGTAILSSANSSWAWERQGVDIFDIRWFGAVPGSANAATTTAAIQAAHDAAFQAGGGTVFIPETPGNDNWWINDTIDWKYRVHMLGAGVAAGVSERSSITNRIKMYGPSVIKLADGADVPMIELDPSDGYNAYSGTSADGTSYTTKWISVSFDGITFHGNGENQTSPNADIIKAKNAIGITIRDCAFFDARGYWLRIRNCNQVHVRDCHFRNLDGRGILFDDVADSHITNNQMGGAHGPLIMLYSRYCWLNNISDNDIWNSSSSTSRDAFTVDTGTEAITLTSHQFATGDPVIFTEYGGGTLPAGLSKTNLFYAIVSDANTFTVSGNYEGALNSTNIVDITDTGSGTFEAGIGPAVGIYMHNAQANRVTVNRIDQHWEEGIRISKGHDNDLIGNQIIDNSYGNSGTFAAIKLENETYGTTISGGVIGEITSTDLDYAISVDSTSYRNTAKLANYVGAMPLYDVNNVSNNIQPKVYIPWSDFNTSVFAADKPVLSSTGSSRQAVWSFTNTVDTLLHVNWIVPEDWQQYRLQGDFFNMTTNTGDAYFQLLWTGLDDGESAATTELSPAQAFTVGSQHARQSVLFNQVFTNEWNLVSFRLNRRTTGLNTLGAQIGFGGLSLVRTK